MSLHAETFSMGVEEEYQIIHPVTRELASSAEPILLEAQKALGSSVQFEIHLSQIEVATPVCNTLTAVRHELQRLRGGVIAAAAQHNRQIAAAGTHPFSLWREQVFTPDQRYLSLEDRYQQLAREQAIFGFHVHVGLSDRHIALQVLNHARLWLAPLLALSVSSPFWEGNATGYMSYRTPHWSRWPFSGPPQSFSSLEEYDFLLDQLLATGAIDDRSKIYWDLRLSERFPTIEMRVNDMCMTIDEAVMIAGLVRALVRTCYEQVTRGEAVPNVRQEMLRAAHWRAARYATNDMLIDVQTDRLVPAQEFMVSFLNYLRPALEAEDDWEEVSQLLNKVLREGTGAARQQEVYERTGELKAVVDFIVAETARQTPYQPS